MPDQDPHIDITRRFETVLSPMLQTAAVPLYSRAIEHDHVRPLGTGSLIAVAEKRFLVTAAHVLQQAQVDQLIAANLVTMVQFSVTGEVTANDGLDVAILDLLPFTAALFDGMRWLRVPDLHLGPVEQAEVCALAGYPAELQQRNGPTRALGYITRPHPGNYADFSCDPNVFLLLDYELNDNAPADAAYGPVPEYLQGISGSAVWHLGAAVQPEEAQPKACAIQTGVFRRPEKLIVKTTRMIEVFRMIGRAYPELRPALLLTLSP